MSQSRGLWSFRGTSCNDDKHREMNIYTSVCCEMRSKGSQQVGGRYVLSRGGPTHDSILVFPVQLAARKSPEAPVLRDSSCLQHVMRANTIVGLDVPLGYLEDLSSNLASLAQYAGGWI